jgi:diguanylate cyclase (GGDEF)-like protein
MPSARLPEHEIARLAALKSYEILDTQCDANFDNVVALAARLIDCPLALVSLVDADRLWIKAAYGLDATETPRTVSFCAHAILQPAEPLMVPDATLDSRFVDNPLVTGAPYIRSYLGVPLVTSEGHALGTLCLFDYAPRHYDAATIATLRGLAQTVTVSLELHRALVRMTKAALTDLLTGLPNRRALLEALTGMLKSHVPVTALMLDLDHFKEVNDVHGHAVGDALLKTVAERLSASLRPGDLAGRLGGDEFVVFLRDVTSEHVALKVTERLRAALHQPVMHDGVSFEIGATIGLALAPFAAHTPEAVLRVADEAMMRAKQQGRGGIGYATAADTSRIEREMAKFEALPRICSPSFVRSTEGSTPSRRWRAGTTPRLAKSRRTRCSPWPPRRGLRCISVRMFAAWPSPPTRGCVVKGFRWAGWR